MAFLLFSQRAKAWEPIALELRGLANVSENEVLDPEVLAAKVGLCLVDARVALESFSEADRSHLLETASNSWSGGVYPKPLPNGKLICIINPNHDRKRSRITLMEEVVHIHRKHKPSSRVTYSPASVCVNTILSRKRRHMGLAPPHLCRGAVLSRPGRRHGNPGHR